jgi:hypothetical protein
MLAPVGLTVKDEARYTKPKPLKRYISENHLMMTSDIPGATVGWREAQREANNHSRREIRNITSTHDIEGAQADTFKHTIQTNRCVNPLLPVYSDLDEGAPLRPIVEPLMNAKLISRPNIKFPSGYVTNSMLPAPSVHVTGGGPGTTSLFATDTGSGSVMVPAAAQHAGENHRNTNFDLFSSTNTAGGSSLNFDMFQLPNLNLTGNGGSSTTGGSVSYASKFDATNADNFNLNFGGTSNNNQNDLFGNFAKPPTPTMQSFNMFAANTNNNGSDSNRVVTSSSGRSASAGPAARSQSAHSYHGQVPTQAAQGASRGSSPRVGSAGRKLVEPGAQAGNIFTMNSNGNSSARRAVGIAERKAVQELQAEINAVRML